MKLLKKAMIISVLSLCLLSNFTYGSELFEIILVDDPIKGHH